MNRKFEQYYQHYLLLHQNKWCRRLHFVGQLSTVALILYILYNRAWFLLLAVPFVVYPFAWVGHYFFEKNKPAALKNPLLAKASDWVMFKDMLLGRVKW